MDAEKALHEAWHRAASALEEEPRFALCVANAGYDPEQLRRTLLHLAPSDCRIAGFSSCLGVLTPDGVCGGEGAGLGLWLASASLGDVGVGLCSQQDDPKSAGEAAVRQAAEDALRPGQMPEAIWLSAGPGHEEEVLAGVRRIIGESVPVIGGSSADDAIAGHWWQFSRDAVMQDGVLAVAFYPKGRCAHLFHSGYVPTAHEGVVEEACGRVLIRLDGAPAAERYDAWTEGAVLSRAQEGNILSPSTFSPLGVAVGEIEGVPYYALLHPERVLDDGSLRLFAEVRKGMRLRLMAGSKQALIDRAGSTLRELLARRHWPTTKVQGVLMAYCAGCMLGVRNELQGVAARLREALGDAPCLVAFTFGEQGCFFDEAPRHANLMIAALVFADG